MYAEYDRIRTGLFDALTLAGLCLLSDSLRHECHELSDAMIKYMRCPHGQFHF